MYFLSKKVSIFHEKGSHFQKKLWKDTDFSVLWRVICKFKWFSMTFECFYAWKKWHFDQKFALRLLIVDFLYNIPRYFMTAHTKYKLKKIVTLWLRVIKRNVIVTRYITLRYVTLRDYATPLLRNSMLRVEIFWRIFGRHAYNRHSIIASVFSITFTYCTVFFIETTEK